MRPGGNRIEPMLSLHATGRRPARFGESPAPLLIAPTRPANDVGRGCEEPELNPIEKTIRSALEKGDAADRAFREKVYRSVHSALERSIANNPQLEDETIRQRRQMLKASISTVESEFVLATLPSQDAQPAAPEDLEPEEDGAEPEEAAGPTEPDDASADGKDSSEAPAAEQEAEDVPSVEVSDDRTYRSVRQDPPEDAAQDRPDADVMLDIEPRITGDDRELHSQGPRRSPTPGRTRAQRSEPIFESDETAEMLSASAEPYSSGLQGEYRAVPKRRRGRAYAMAFLSLTLLAAAAMGVWWTVDQGLFLSAEDRDTSVPNPPLALEAEEFAPEGAAPSPPITGVADDTADWVTIFDPSDPTRVTTPPGAEAAVIDSDGGPLLRIRTASAEEPVVFDVGQGILDGIAGRRTVFNVVAAAEEGQPTQISVTCDFGVLGDCGRNRYDVTAEQTDFLFDLDVPAGTPAGGGTISIVSDVENQGRAVDIRDTRVSVQE